MLFIVHATGCAYCRVEYFKTHNSHTLHTRSVSFNNWFVCHPIPPSSSHIRTFTKVINIYSVLFTIIDKYITARKSQ